MIIIQIYIKISMYQHNIMEIWLRYKVLNASTIFKWARSVSDSINHQMWWNKMEYIIIHIQVQSRCQELTVLKQISDMQNFNFLNSKILIVLLLKCMCLYHPLFRLLVHERIPIWDYDLDSWVWILL